MLKKPLAIIDRLNCVLTEQSAESVLQLDTNCVKAVFVMAEALYYKCSFEKAMVLYYRGMVRINERLKFHHFIFFIFIRISAQGPGSGEFPLGHSEVSKDNRGLHRVGRHFHGQRRPIRLQHHPEKSRHEFRTI